MIPRLQEPLDEHIEAFGDIFRKDNIPGVGTAEEAAQFADALDELPEALSTVFSYSDALAETYGLEAFLPPPRLETCLNRLTLHRDEAFLDDAARLAAYIAPEDGETTSVTFIW